MNDILITGGGGYIGSVLTPMLLEMGHRVTVLDMFMYKQSSLIDCCKYPNFTVINGDARDEETLKRALDGKDFIFPLAALVGFPLCDKDKVAAASTNFGAIETLVRLRDPAQKIISPAPTAATAWDRGSSTAPRIPPSTPSPSTARPRWRRKRRCWRRAIP